MQLYVQIKRALHNMVMVRFKLELDVENSSEKAAILALRRWKSLIQGGQRDVCQAEQKEAFLAGLYLQNALPELAEKLAQNLSSAELEELDSLYYSCGSVPDKNSRSEQQTEILQMLQELKKDIKNFLLDSDLGEPIVNKTFNDAPAPVRKEVEPNSRGEEQTEILQLLQELKKDIKNYLLDSDLGEPRVNTSFVDSYRKDMASVRAKTFNNRSVPVRKEVDPGANEKICH